MRKKSKAAASVRDSWTNLKHGIKVYEASNGFYVTDLWSEDGRTVGMGEGVDMYSNELGEPILCGSPAFYEALKLDVAHNAAELREAYFGSGGDDEEKELPN